MHQSIQAFYDRKYTQGSEIPRTSKIYTIDCVPDDTPLDILDVGCGSGSNSLALAAKGHKVRGVDISEEGIARYRSHGFDGHVVDLESGIDYADGTFDLAFCSEVIEHMTSPEILAGEMFRIIKPGGRLVLSTPNSAFWLYRALGMIGFTVSELQRKTLSILLAPQPAQNFAKRRFPAAATDRAQHVSDRPGAAGTARGVLPKLLHPRTRFRTGSIFGTCRTRRASTMPCSPTA